MGSTADMVHVAVYRRGQVHSYLVEPATCLDDAAVLARVTPDSIGLFHFSVRHSWYWMRHLAKKPRTTHPKAKP